MDESLPDAAPQCGQLLAVQEKTPAAVVSEAVESPMNKQQHKLLDCNPIGRRIMTRKTLYLLLVCGVAVLLSAMALASCSGGGLRTLTDGAVMLARGGSGVGSPWAMFGKSSLRTRLSEHTGPPTNKLKWKYNTASNPWYSSPAIAADGTLYIGDAGGAPKLYAVSSSGQLKWTFATLGGLDGPAISADGSTVYVGGGGDLWQSGDTKIYAISSSGSLRWTYTTGGKVMSSPVIDADGIVYVGSFDGKLYALYPGGLDANRLKWAFATGGSVRSSPAVGYDGTLYFGSFDGYVYAVNPDGTEKWRHWTGHSIMSSPAVGTDGAVYIGGGTENKLYAFNPDGSLRWAYSTAYSVYSSPAIGADGALYVGDYDVNGGSYTGHLYAINSDGSLRWTFDVGYGWSGVFSSPAIGADGTIYAQDIGGIFFAVNPSGTLKWSYTLPSTMGNSGSSAAIGTDGTVYIASDGSSVKVKGKWTFTGGLFAFGPGLN